MSKITLEMLKTECWPAESSFRFEIFYSSRYPNAQKESLKQCFHFFKWKRWFCAVICACNLAQCGKDTKKLFHHPGRQGLGSRDAESSVGLHIPKNIRLPYWPRSFWPLLCHRAIASLFICMISAPLFIYCALRVGGSGGEGASAAERLSFQIINNRLAPKLWINKVPTPRYLVAHLKKKKSSFIFLTVFIEQTQCTCSDSE